MQHSASLTLPLWLPHRPLSFPSSNSPPSSPTLRASRCYNAFYLLSFPTTITTILPLFLFDTHNPKPISHNSKLKPSPNLIGASNSSSRLFKLLVKLSPSRIFHATLVSTWLHSYSPDSFFRAISLKKLLKMMWK